MVINDIILNDDDNGIYISASIYKCNNALIFNSKDGKEQKIYCIEGSINSVQSIGEEENKVFITQDGKRFVTVPLTEYSNEIVEGQRFILNGDAFKVAEIYRGKSGILEMKLQQEEKLNGDTEIAIQTNNPTGGDW